MPKQIDPIFGVRVTTEDSYFKLDGGSESAHRKSSFPGGGCMSSFKWLLLIYSFKCRSAFQPWLAITAVVRILL